MELGDGEAMVALAAAYEDGDAGLPQDFERERELLLRAGELGRPNAYYKLGLIYEFGQGAAIDLDKATHYYKLAAVAGDHRARYNLGAHEWNAGNGKEAVKHLMISAGMGDDQSMEVMRLAYQKGHATNDEFEKALRTHKEAKIQLESHQREEARREAARREAPECIVS